MISFIFAATYKGGFGGNDGVLPWHLRNDMEYFKEVTAGSTVVMGSKSYFSIPKRFRPLSGRVNIVLSRTVIRENIVQICDKQDLAKYLNNVNANEKIFIIGGKQIFDLVTETGIHIDWIYWTKVIKDVSCGLYIEPEKYLRDFQLYSYSNMYLDNDLPHIFCIFGNIFGTNGDPYISPKIQLKPVDSAHEEHQYLDLMEKILCAGELRKTRNAATFSIFGESLKFNLRRGFPLLTSKKVFTRGIIEELLWFLGAKTDVTELKDKGVHIWDGNTTKEFLESVGLPYDENIAGPIYGWQWRKFGQKYEHSHGITAGVDHGFDQIQHIIRELRTNPQSRRIFMSAWNPNQLDQMCLPPCHVSYQFYVSHGNRLSCKMYQRSADVFLGLPFNIASTAILTHLLAKHCDMEAEAIEITIGDAHIYEAHLPSVVEQLRRRDCLYDFPKFNVKEKRVSIEDYIISDFEISDYVSHGKISAPMIA